MYGGIKAMMKAEHKHEMMDMESKASRARYDAREEHIRATMMEDL